MKKVIFALVAAGMTMTSCMNEEFPNATSYGQLNVNVSNDLQMNTRASVSDLSTWIPKEYELNLTYADDKVAFSEYLTALREEKGVFYVTLSAECEEEIGRSEEILQNLED